MNRQLLQPSLAEGTQMMLPQVKQISKKGKWGAFCYNGRNPSLEWFQVDPYGKSRSKGLPNLTRREVWAEVFCTGRKGRDFEVIIPTGPNEGPRAGKKLK